MKAASKYVQLLQSLLQDLAAQCSTYVLSRDMKTIVSRCEHEGLSFLTITLPNFTDAVFLGIEEGYVTPTCFQGFRKRGCLPAFLSGFTELIFDRSTGRKLDEPSIFAVQSIRQIGFLFKKINLACSEERVAKAVQSFLQIEDDMRDYVVDKAEMHLFEQVSRVVVSSTFPCGLDECELLPHHGPGSTMEKLSGNRKYIPKRFTWPEQLNRSFTRGLTIYPSEEWENCSKEENVTCLKPTVRVVHVPKTLKAPRVIAMEPVAMQMAQQSVKDFMMGRIERGPITGGHINFRDQSVNQDLAMSSSVTHDLATIDLSAASDRVHKGLVARMLKVNPSLRKFIFSSRSTHAKVDGQTIFLNKFASMGSALCFPVESLVFFCIILTALCKNRGDSFPSVQQLKRLAENVFVYGDDLIVPTKAVDTVMSTLESFGCIVNKQKSYYKSDFRESCGMDAYKGVMVTPIYMRSPIPDSKSSVPSLVSLVSTANQLFKAGHVRTSAYIVDIVQRTLGFVLPSVTDRCEGLGLVDGNDRGKRRYNRNLQRLEVQTLVPRISLKKDEIRGVPALLKCLLKLERGQSSRDKVDYDRPYYDTKEQLYRIAISNKEHLSKTPVRGALTLKRRWVAV